MKFSVIIPTLNRSDMIDRALESARAQQDVDFEIIVVDDGSTADEAAKIAAHVAGCPQAKLLRLDQNGGASRARNLGVQASSGDIVAFLDSDDWWLPDRLKWHLPCFGDPHVVATYNRARVTRGDVLTRRTKVGRPKPAQWTMPVALAGWNFVGGCSLVCVRRSAFDHFGGFDTSLPSCEDWDLWIKLSTLGTFDFIPEVLGYYNAGTHSRLTTSQNKIMIGHEKVFALARTIPVTNAEKHYVEALNAWTMAEVALMFGLTDEAVAKLLHSLRIQTTFTAIKRTPAIVFAALAAKFGGGRGA